jgi:RHS repeat-associated protein
VSQTYNGDLLVDSQSVNGGNTVGFTYDLDGLVNTAGTETLVHHPTTGLLTDTSVGIIDTEYGYNAFGELTFIQYTHGTTVLYEATLERDDFGRVVSKEEIVDDPTPILYEYDYDDRGRLELVWEDGIPIAEYDYDANGNILEEKVASITGTYDAQDRQTAWGDYTFSYTNGGTLANRTNTTSSEVYTYDYDELGGLREVDLDGQLTITYRVDALGRRVSRHDGTTERRWLYQDSLNPVAELDGNGALVSRFVYASRAHVPDYMVQGTDTYYRLVTDHLGTVRLVVDASDGTIVHRLDYDPRGRVLSETGTVGFQPFGYAGGLYDPDTGLVRFGARDYDPETGRWTAKDPILFDGGDTNLYIYAANNSMNRVDPTGLKIINDGRNGWERRQIRRALRCIRRQFGKETLDELDASYQDVTIMITPAKPSQSRRYSDGNAEIDLQPGQVYSSCDGGFVPASVCQILAHEIGHLLTGIPTEPEDEHSKLYPDWDNVVCDKERRPRRCPLY